MDKIIDGVDVSECEHYRAKLKYKLPFDDYTVEQDKCHYSGIEVIQNCKGNKGCIYKQLKRLQPENEHYRKEAYRLADGLNKTENLAFTYKQTLKEIKEIIKDCINGKCFTCKYNKEDAENCIDNKHNEIIDKINDVIGAE